MAESPKFLRLKVNWNTMVTSDFRLEVEISRTRNEKYGP